MSFNESLDKVDPAIAEIVKKETHRQENGLELIASENYASIAVMQTQASVLTNKYAEGYPTKRFYDGCEFVDQSEQLAIDRVKKIFGTEYANVQPHSGSSANMAVFHTILKPGDKFLGMDLSQGGHLTHGSPVNFSGKLFEAHHYGLDLETERIDYNIVEDIAKKIKPKMLIAGASAYPRTIDFKTMGEIAKKVGAYLLVDMAHIAGLIAADQHPSPVGHADFITSTTHKTLRGPRGGIILSQDEWAKKLNSAIFPGIQGGPLEHVIAAKAVAFHEALQPEFKDYQKQVIKNSQRLAATLIARDIKLVTGGTDNHLILINTNSVNLSGKEASLALEEVGITCNKNMIPGDTRSAFITSGVRIGTPAITTRGLKENEMEVLGNTIADILQNFENKNIYQKAKNTVQELCNTFPIYKDLL